jgi:hypothetical protein
MTFGRFNFLLSFVPIRDVDFDEIGISLKSLSSVWEEDIAPIDT